jgi:hypothetical protein
MSYTPNNTSVYVAAFAGAVAAMTMSDRVISSTDTAAYQAQVNAAGAFAQTFDTQWGMRTTTTLDLNAITQAAGQSYILRTPNSIKLGDYSSIVAAIITAITGSEAYFASQGIIPPLPNAGGRAGLRVIPPVDAFSAIRYEFELQTDGTAPTFGVAPSSHLASTGTQNVPITGGYSNNGGGPIIQAGPFGRALDYYAAGSETGGSNTDALPYTPGQNASVTYEAGFFARGAPVGHGVILSKAWVINTWSAPFNSVNLTFLDATTTGGWEIAILDSSDLSAEVGLDITNGRDCIKFGQYNHLMMVIDVAAKRSFGYLNGTQRGFFTFTTGPAYNVTGSSGPYLVGGNIVNTNDASNIVYDYIEVANVARTPAQALARAQSYLGYIIPTT